MRIQSSEAQQLFITAAIVTHKKVRWIQPIIATPHGIYLQAPEIPRFWGPIKTFTLRGIKDSPPYLHDGRLLALHDKVEFSNLVLQLKLSAEEKQSLVAYMQALKKRIIRRVKAPMRSGAGGYPQSCHFFVSPMHLFNLRRSTCS